MTDIKLNKLTEFSNELIEIQRLKKTLAEIKEISENVIKNVSNICIETTPMFCIHKQIIQKINESGV